MGKESKWEGGQRGERKRERPPKSEVAEREIAK